MTPKNPQGFTIETEATRAAFQNGYQRRLGWQDGWGQFASTTIPGTIFVGAASPSGPYLLSQNQPGAALQTLPTLTALHAAISWTYDNPTPILDAFTALTAPLPKSTEVERLVVQRIGQDLFRAALMTRWNSRCPLTGITDPALLRASHIIPWAACETDAERLNPDNGLLLSALWDAAFDKGLVSFNDEGTPIFNKNLSAAAEDQLIWKAPIPLTAQLQTQLSWHRLHLFGQASNDLRTISG